MAYINGYQFATEQEAITARESCDAYYGIPVSPEDVTQNWVDYRIADLNDPQFWYIVYDDSLLPVLGEPVYFEVNEPVPQEQVTEDAEAVVVDTEITPENQP